MSETEVQKPAQIDKSKATTTTVKPTTAADEAERAQQLAKLDDLTRDIKAAQHSFVVIADGVFQIADHSLFLLRKNASGEKYKSLADYTAEQFQFSGIETSRFKNGGHVLSILRLHKATVLPQNESQTRALWRMKKDEKKLVKVWNSVVKQGKATAEQIEVVGKLKKEPNPNTEPSKFDGVAHVAVVTVATEQEAKTVSERFAPHAESNSQKGGYAVRVGIDKATDLCQILEDFEVDGSAEMTIRIIR
jgi:hypothetical protein